jgi:hypothetical protein
MGPPSIGFVGIVLQQLTQGNRGMAGEEGSHQLSLVRACEPLLYVLINVKLAMGEGGVVVCRPQSLGAVCGMLFSPCQVKR